MIDFKKILCPVDFSPCSHAALDHAMWLAVKCNVPGDVLHVVNMPQSFVGAEIIVDASAKAQPIDEFARLQAKREMQTFMASVDKPKGVSFGTRVEFGSTVDTVLQVVDEGGYGLIVTGTHGRTGLTHFLLGSVAERLVRQSPIPVMTVRDTPSSEE